MNSDTISDANNEFDPFEKERALREESSSWDTTNPVDAEDDDIPVIDFSDYFTTLDTDALKQVADRVRMACEQTGFFTIIGHGISSERMEEMFGFVRKFPYL